MKNGAGKVILFFGCIGLLVLVVSAGIYFAMAAYYGLGTTAFHRGSTIRWLIDSTIILFLTLASAYAVYKVYVSIGSGRVGRRR
jgi:hypothetical protein